MACLECDSARPSFARDPALGQDRQPQLRHLEIVKAIIQSHENVQKSIEKNQEIIKQKNNKFDLNEQKEPSKEDYVEIMKNFRFDTVDNFKTHKYKSEPSQLTKKVLLHTFLFLFV